MSRFDLQRQTTHKLRADWFQERTSYPSREVYPSDLHGCVRHDEPVWTEVGPLNIGGRITSMVVDPRNPDHIYLGSAGGGVWESKDAGRSWQHAWSDHAATLIIGSLAIDPGNPDVLYAGTGEANMSADNYPAIGIFKSPDGGKTWSQVGVSGNFRQVQGGGAGEVLIWGLPRRIGTIAVDPFDPHHIFAGGVTHTEQENGGLFETRDGGATWNPATDRSNPQKIAIGRFSTSPRGGFVTPLVHFCHCVVFHPTQKGVVFATVEARGTQSGIWKSVDGGMNWTHASKGLPTGDQFGRTSLAVAPNSSTVWALAGQQGTHSLVGVFRSDDLGETWQRCADGAFAKDGQLSYTNCIAVDPQNPLVAVVGTLEVHKTIDGGQTWTAISNSNLDVSAHADHHALHLSGDRLYSGNDGGFAVYSGSGKKWETRNTGLAVSMIYEFDVAPSDPWCIAIGTQDNGIWARGIPAVGQTQIDKGDFRRVVTGDGGFIRYDPQDETRIYASTQRVVLWRLSVPGGFQNLTAPIRDIPRAERQEIWQCVLALDPSPLADPKSPRAVYAGTNRLWRSKDEGLSWQAISISFDDSTISAIEIAPADPNVIYVGTVNGGFYRSKDAGKTWSRNLAGPLSPGRIITRISSDPQIPTAIGYTIGLIAPESTVTTPVRERPLLLQRGQGVIQRKGPDGTKIIGFAHLYVSEDGGDTWEEMDDSLPNLPASAIAAPVEDTLYVAHDGGVSFLQVAKTAPNSALRPPPTPQPEPVHQPPPTPHPGPGHQSVFEAEMGSMLPDFGPPAARSEPGIQATEISGNLPNVRITGLVLRRTPEQAKTGGGDLYVSTYGRGLWKIGLADLNTWLTKPKLDPSASKPNKSAGPAPA